MHMQFRRDGSFAVALRRAIVRLYLRSILTGQDDAKGFLLSLEACQTWRQSLCSLWYE